MNPNIQKLLQCWWRKPVNVHGKPTNYTVNYSIIYERINHIENAQYREYNLPSGGSWKEIISHSDELDKKIIDAIVNHFAVELKLKDFTYSQRETTALINKDTEDLQKALLSKHAVGWACRPLSIRNIETGQVRQLNTKIHFFDPQLTHEVIHPDIPLMIDVSGVSQEIFETLATVQFMKKDEAEKIIGIFNPPITLKF